NENNLVFAVIVEENIEFGRSFVKEFVLEITDNKANKLYISSYFNKIIYDLLLKLYTTIMSPVQTDIILSNLINDLQDILENSEIKSSSNQKTKPTRQ